MRTPTHASARYRSRWAPFAEAAGIGSSAALWILLAEHIVPELAFRNPIFNLAAIFSGVILADAVSGFVHWFCDTFFEETTPLIGTMIGPFREHHRDPLAMTRHGFFELNGNNCLALTPILGTAWLFEPMEFASDGTTFGYSLLLSFAATITATNQFHLWAHDPEPPRIARLLQRLGLALTPAHHQRHHAPPHRSAYCVTTGWANCVADRMDIFTRAERILVALGVPRSISNN